MRKPKEEDREQIPLERRTWWQRINFTSFDVFTFVIYALVVIWIGYSVINNIVLNYQTKQDIKAAKEEIKQLEMEQERLKSLLAYYETDSYQEIELRRRLLLKKPGEIVVALKGSEPLNKKEEVTEEAQSEKSTYEEWFDLYFGPKF